MISGKNFRTITDQCWSGKRRIEDMDAEGVDAHVLSPMPELLSYWFDPEDTLDFSRLINEELSHIIRTNPKKFFGLGMLPLQDPELAAKEISVLKRDFGLQGAEIGTHVNGRSIGDPFFEPFFAEAEAQSFSIFVHPLHPAGTDRIVGPGVLQALINFPTDTAFALASLITGGILQKYPDLRILASHGGGAFSSILPRLNAGWSKFKDVYELSGESPEFYAKKLYFDTLVYDSRSLENLLNIFEVNQLVIGSDYPFSIREKNPGHWRNSLSVNTEEWEKIAYKNCLSFLHLSSEAFITS